MVHGAFPMDLVDTIVNYCNDLLLNICDAWKNVKNICCICVCKHNFCHYTSCDIHVPICTKMLYICVTFMTPYYLQLCIWKFTITSNPFLSQPLHMNIENICNVIFFFNEKHTQKIFDCMVFVCCACYKRRSIKRSV